jgi:hypothetical protein
VRWAEGIPNGDPCGKIIRTVVARLLTAACIPYAKALEEPKANGESVGTELDGLVILQEVTKERTPV